MRLKKVNKVEQLLVFITWLLCSFSGDPSFSSLLLYVITEGGEGAGALRWGLAGVTLVRDIGSISTIGGGCFTVVGDEVIELRWVIVRGTELREVSAANATTSLTYILT